ncbi:class I SAM-dependent methyltransferase [Ensifer sp. BR816]|uniref:class I SAM-dependent methyltransferase n=1 Tax=Rhizobium sp. (strain BR816) TaxID=1057002 RepID=UPI00036BD178|nr:methyltransferase domain-containing protein [Ensifer sp. BR816]
MESSRDPAAFREFEHTGWETASRGYDQHFARLTRQTVPALLAAARVAKGKRVLDVCTGPGMLARAAVEREAQVVGLDFSGKVIKIARRNAPDAEFLEGDAQALPFDADSFDAVVCGYGIIHVPNPEAALCEMHRVLKPGGYLAASVWQSPAPTNGFGLLFGAVKIHGNLDVPLPHGPDFFQFSEPEKLRTAFEECGFADVAVAGVDQIWEVAAPLGMITAILEGGVRARGLLLAQTEEVQGAISATVANGIVQFRSADGTYRVPMPALVGSGRK